MTVQVRLAEEYRERDNYLRAVELKVGSGQYRLALPAIDNRRQPQVVPTESKYSLVENNVKITLDDLRELDGDREKQRRFIEHSMQKLLVGGELLTIPKLLIRERQSIAEKDIEYLADVISASGNIITPVPLVYLYSYSNKGRIRVENAVDIDRYLSFVKGFLKEMKSRGTTEVGLTIQSNIPHSEMTNLLAMYKDFATPIALYDAAGKSTIDAYVQLRPVIGIGQKNVYGLSQKQGEKYMLYSFDSKSSSGRNDIVPAINLLQIDSAFSSFGPRHTLKIGVIIQPAPIPRLYYGSQYSYARSNVEECMREFAEWAKKSKVDFENNEELIRRFRRDFEQEGLLDSATKLMKFAKDGSLDKILSNNSYVSSYVKRIKSYNKKLLQSTLD